MGTHIESAATAFPHHRLYGAGALHLSDVAARSCLARGHHHATELDMLINVGLYKDHGIAEPALASIIQEDIGANLGHPPRPGEHGTFSFDVLDGGCGVVTAAHLLDGFLRGGAAKLGLIVAGDADPSPHTSHGFAFAPAGGALLLSHADDDLGFRHFRFRTFPEDAGLFEAHTRWDPHGGRLRTGHHMLEMYVAPTFSARAVDHALVVVRELLAATDLETADIDLLVTTQYPHSFATDLADSLGIDESRVPRPGPELSHAHTAGPIAALEAALVSGELARARNTLFVTAGAGIAIGCALYRSVEA